MPDAHYLNPRLAALYDLDSPWSVDRDFYLALAGAPQQHILDLGCGTGLLCDAYAALGHKVTGVDPAAAMLDVARRKRHGAAVEWVTASAEDYTTEKRFDLIVMTGNAFQVLLTDETVTRTLTAMRRHLKPDGMIAFETRNPAIDWAKRWNYTMMITTPTGPVRETRRFLSWHDNRLTFDLDYEFPDETFSSRSIICFRSAPELAGQIENAGLELDKIVGDYTQAFDANTTQEMIFIVRQRR